MATNMTDTYGTKAEVITASDTANVEAGFLYVGTAGNVQVVMADRSLEDGVTAATADKTIFTALAAGVVHPIRVKRVMATSTTASNIVIVR